MDPVRLIEIVFFLGLVIFVHELGHFLVARWCGVLVERFSIGFGPVLLSFKRGDTEYAISLIPLGGYVKMLGQSDTPTIEEPSDDMRSYQNKSVPQRMAIISAGVVMNIIFGCICFAIAYMVGVPTIPATVGSTSPGRPAWMAGMEPGDRITEIDGHIHPSYEDLKRLVMSTRPGTGVVDLDVDRDGEELHFDLIPIKDHFPIIGVAPSLSLGLMETKDGISPTIPNSVASDAKDPAFEPGDTVTAVDGKAVSTYQQYNDLLYAHRKDPVKIRVARKPKENEKTAPDAEITVAPATIRTIGLRMTMGEVTAVRPGSPAAKAVDATGADKPIEAGDTIVGIDTLNDFDPMRLADLVTDKAGQRVELTVLRKARTPEEFKVYVVPDDVPTWNDFSHMALFPIETDMSIPSIGVAYKVGTVIHSVEEGSPAERTGKIQPADVVTAIDFYSMPQSSPEGESAGENKLAFNAAKKGWPGAFWGLQNTQFHRLVLHISRPAEGGKTETFTVNVDPVDKEDWPFHLRGVGFVEEHGIKKASSFLMALRMGADYTWTTMLSVYATLQGLFERSLDPEILSGPLRLGYTAYVVSQDFMTLILLIGLINVNLAVVNFLPIPVLDGGHMMFLLYEAITRRKPSETMLQASSLIGFACILLLMGFVLYQDFKFFLGM